MEHDVQSHGHAGLASWAEGSGEAFGPFREAEGLGDRKVPNDRRIQIMTHILLFDCCCNIKYMQDALAAVL